MVTREAGMQVSRVTSALGCLLVSHKLYLSAPGLEFAEGSVFIPARLWWPQFCSRPYLMDQNLDNTVHLLGVPILCSP